MPETIQGYIEAVEEQIRWRRARSVVSLELRRHLEDQRDDFAAEGLEAWLRCRECWVLL